MLQSAQTNNWKIIGIPLLLATISGICAAVAGFTHMAILLALMFASIGFMAASPNWRTWISIGAIAFAILMGVVIVWDEPTDINQWYVMKIVFVIYFAVFVGHLISRFLGGFQTLLVIALSVGMFICFWIQHEFLMGAVAAGAPVYTGPTFCQDIFFGISAAIAAELFNPATPKDPPSSKKP